MHNENNLVCIASHLGPWEYILASHALACGSLQQLATFLFLHTELIQITMCFFFNHNVLCIFCNYDDYLQYFGVRVIKLFKKKYLWTILFLLAAASFVDVHRGPWEKHLRQVLGMLRQKSTCFMQCEVTNQLVSVYFCCLCCSCYVCECLSVCRCRLIVILVCSGSAGAQLDLETSCLDRCCSF